MILEAMKMMDECPVGFVVQSTFDDTAFTKRIFPRIPMLGPIIIRNAIKNGEIYLRPDKVDSQLPTFYILKGWHVRNLSQRKDPLTNNAGEISLKYSRFSLKNR